LLSENVSLSRFAADALVSGALLEECGSEEEYEAEETDWTRKPKQSYYGELLLKEVRKYFSYFILSYLLLIFFLGGKDKVCFCFCFGVCFARF
jgi:hypothetical protein